MRMYNVKSLTIFGLFAAAQLLVAESASALVIWTDLLETNGATNGTSITVNSAIFSVAPPNNAAGTGNINSFLRLENPNANTPYEKGYNTSYRGSGSNKVEFDQKTDGNFTHDVLISALPIVTLNSIDYFELIFDANEPQADGKETLSLQKLELWGSDTGMDGDYASGLGTRVWDLGDNRIELDQSVIGSGSGKFDIVALFPTSLFVNFDDDDFFYLYNELGKADGVGLPAQAGFEEWAYRDTAITPGTPPTGGGGPTLGGTSIPTPGTLMLMGIGLLGMRRAFSA